MSACLQEGPIAVLFDDTFEGVADKGDALLAVSELVCALGSRFEVGVIPMLDACNSMGARDLGILPGTPSAWETPILTSMLRPDSPVRAAFLLGVDSVDEPTIARLQSLDLLVVHELFMSEVTTHAAVILPAASFAEKAGTFTNTERRVQALRPGVPSPGIALPDWQILVNLSQYFDRALDYSSPQEVWNDIRRAVPAYVGLEYSDLGDRGARPASLVPA